MQAGSFAPSRQRSPAYSDSESDHAESSTSSTAGLQPGSARPQRPLLAQSQTHTQSGSFIRIKRKNTSTPLATTNDVSPVSTHGERSVEQVHSKTCFICYEEEGEESSGSTHGKWVHPCTCSLVAHEDCLLRWVVVSKPTASKRVPVACPQCNTPYTIKQLNFPLLNIIEKVEDVWAKNVGKVLMLGAGLGSWTLLSLYGVWAIRKFAGDRVAEQLLLRKATRWITAPLVLPILALSRTHVLDSLLPFLPLTLVLNSSLPTSYPYYAIEPYPLADLQIGFPPNPALTLCLLPWVRAIYTAVRRRLFQAVIGTRRPTPINSPASPPGNGNANANAVPLPAEADFAANHHRENAPAGHFERLEGMLDDPAEGRRVVVTVSSGARLLAGTLAFPWAAATAGSILFWIAKRHNNGKGLLAKILGMGLAGTISPSTLFGLPNFLPPAREYVDPVWWRNAVGGALLVLVKDAWSMTRQLMELKREQSRRIQSQTFREGLEV